jgi:hypothetical protein
MRTLVLLCCLVGVGAGQQLRVKSASAKSVQLEWSGSTGPVTVERSNGPNMQKIGTADQATYEDTTIDRFGTYRYRVTAGSKSSNEVTVGPPPGGVTNAAPVPKGSDTGKYGSASAIALDDNGDPVIAFEWVDPNGDNEYSDNEIRFVSWSRAAYHWMPPVKVQVVAEIPNQNGHPLSIACDSKTGLLAIATPIQDKGALALLSKDRGATWTATPLPGVGATAYSTAMATADGKMHLVVSADGGAQYFTGQADDVTSWKATPLPVSAGWKQPQKVNVVLTTDASGKPAAAWYEEQEEGEGRRFQFWRPGGNAVVAVETKRSNDNPDLALTFGGAKFGLLIHTALDEKDEDHGVWYTQSPDGAAWSKPSKLPVDGPRTTNPPLDVALDSHARMVAVFGSNGGSGSTGCNFPALSRSTDGAQWKTCGPGKAEGGNFGPQPSTLHAIEAGNDKVYVLWQETGENKFHEGVLIWHER